MSARGTLRQETERTVWSRSLAAQLSGFLRTEAGSSGVLVAAIVAALVWVNVSAASYDLVWGTPLTVRLGDFVISMDVRTWISTGLMSFFFLVIGLEARREFNLGSLRERRQIVLPILAGTIGMAVPVLIYLLINRGLSSEHGWGTAMSTDTALALGLLTILSRQLPERVKGFLLTLFIVDDLIALVVIAVAYTRGFQLVPLVIAIAAFAVFLVCRRIRVIRGLTPILAVVSWGGLLFSGVDPVVIGLVIGLSTRAYSPERAQLEEAVGRFRQFREQPTPALARDATASLQEALSPNERLQSAYHPWTSYVIVPLFALANAGIRLDPQFLGTAYFAPVTLGVLIGYVVGKPLAVIATTWIASKLSGGRLTPPVGWAAVAGTGTIAGVGFTVSVLVAGLAFHGAELEQAKLGVLSAAVVASLLTWLVYRVTAMLPAQRRARALLGSADQLIDLSAQVDLTRDHVRGPDGALIIVVEYGDFQCPHCGHAEHAVRTLTEEVRFVWRHLPISEIHPNAEMAAEAAEAAGAQGAFWPMHDLLLSHQSQLRMTDLVDYAGSLQLDVDRFSRDLDTHRFRIRVEEDTESADASGVSGTPTFFINGRRHYGAYDVDSLRTAISAAYLEATR